MTKLENVNGHHIRRHDDMALAALVCAMRRIGTVQATLETAMPVLKERAKSLHEIADMGRFLISARPIDITEKAAKSLTADARATAALHPRLESLKTGNTRQSRPRSAHFCPTMTSTGRYRTCLACRPNGNTCVTGIFDVLALLDKAEVLGRLQDQI